MSSIVQDERMQKGLLSKRKREDIYNDELLGLEVLCYLDNEKFPMKNPGTYIYKDLILELIYIISEDDLDEEFLNSTVQNPYSFIYEDVAKYTHGIEIIDMHVNIFSACPNDEFKRGYLNKALEIANDILSKEKGKSFILTRKKSEEI